MSIQLRYVDTVVTGHFNPHIIVPPWLDREGIIDGDNLRDVTVITGPDTSFTYRFEAGTFTWQVSHGRLVVGASTEADTSAKIIRVLKALPHTPVTAIGHNFQYECEADKWNGLAPRLGDTGLQDLSKLGTPQTVLWQGAIAREGDFLIGTKLEQSADSISISMNFHRPATDTKQVAEFAKRFADDLAESRRLIKELYKETVEK